MSYERCHLQCRMKEHGEARGRGGMKGIYNKDVYYSILVARSVLAL
jgi:hypothetical protein